METQSYRNKLYSSDIANEKKNAARVCETMRCGPDTNRTKKPTLLKHAE
jgi:hypothetical protein